MKRWVVAVLLSWLAIERTDFSLETISAPWIAQRQEAPFSEEVERALAQPYFYLGKGRQAFVFVSKDGKTVLKFFNRRYIEMPWYAALPLPSSWKEGERAKRKKRQTFYSESYPIAEALFKEETGILYVHMGKSEGDLGRVFLKDRASRWFSVDLNAVPFVLQKRGEPLYPALNEQNLRAAIDAFSALVAKRISYGIADGEHDVEHNFGYLDGKVFYFDPGRLFFSEKLQDPEEKRREWGSSTHRFRQWLEREHPEMLTVFDQESFL